MPPAEQLLDELGGNGMAVEEAGEDSLAEKAHQERGVPFRQRDEAFVRGEAAVGGEQVEMGVPLQEVSGGGNLQALDPALPLYEMHTLEDAVARSLDTRRLTHLLLLAFALAALTLAALGIYGVTALDVGQLNEFGIRLALGASSRDVVRPVLGEGLRIVALGAAIGLAGTASLARLLRSLLFEVEPIDPLTFAAVAPVLGAVALLACYVPARGPPTWTRSRLSGTSRPRARNATACTTARRTRPVSSCWSKRPRASGVTPPAAQRSAPRPRRAVPASRPRRAPRRAAAP
jgi:putative ABC transport system permease protein